MTREELIEVMARAMCVADFYNPDIIDFDGRENWKGYIRGISAALTALEAAGVRLVPVEATDQMTFAAEDILALSKRGGAIGQTLVSPASGIWEAMLAASPYAQKEQTHESY